MTRRVTQKDGADAVAMLDSEKPARKRTPRLHVDPATGATVLAPKRKAMQAHEVSSASSCPPPPTSERPDVRRPRRPGSAGHGWWGGRGVCPPPRVLPVSSGQSDALRRSLSGGRPSATGLQGRQHGLVRASLLAGSGSVLRTESWMGCGCHVARPHRDSVRISSPSR